MSKKRRKQKQGKGQVDATASVDADASDKAASDITPAVNNGADNELGQQAESLAAAQSDHEEAVEIASDSIAPTSQNIEDAEAFGDAGTEYIEGFLREELGLDGDLTDDEFALAALDFLGDESDGGTVFFNPEELGEMAAQERMSIAQALEFDDDAFAKSVEELEEAIAAVSDPEFQKEGTVMVSLPDSASEDAEAILANDGSEAAAEETSVAETIDTVMEASESAEAELVAIAEAVAETKAEDSLDVVAEAAQDEPELPKAIADTLLEVETEAPDAPVAEVTFSKEDLALETLVAEPSASVNDARLEAEASMAAVSDAEQAELDEAMRELLEIQAMLDEDSANDANHVEDEPVALSAQDSESVSEVSEESAENAAITTEATEESPTVETESGQTTLFEDDDLTEEEQALLLEMIAEEEAAKADAIATADESDESDAPVVEEAQLENGEAVVADAAPELEPAVEQPQDELMLAETEPVVDEVDALTKVPEADAADVLELPVEAVAEADALAFADELIAESEVDDEEAAILAMMAELEGMDLDSIDLDNIDLNDLSAEDALNELASLIDESSSEDSAIEAALAQLDAATESITAAGLAEIEPDQFEETSDYLDTLVAALDEGVSDIGLGESSTLELIAGDDRFADDKEQLIVFTIGDSEYAVPIDNVIEVGEPISATTVPFVPRWVRGVINLRGEIVSLIDLREYFEADTANKNTGDWMIVAQNRDASMVVGFIVDDVRGNRQFGDADLAELTSDIEDPSTKYLKRIYQQEEGLVVALDFDKLLDSADMRQFEPT